MATVLFLCVLVVFISNIHSFRIFPTASTPFSETYNATNSSEFEHNTIICTQPQCEIICDAPFACHNTTINSTLSNSLHLSCSTNTSCHNIDIISSPKQSLSILCSADSACFDATFNSYHSSLDLECTAPQACDFAHIYCPPNHPCNIQCVGPYDPCYNIEVYLESETSNVNIVCENNNGKCVGWKSNFICDATKWTYFSLDDIWRHDTSVDGIIDVVCDHDFIHDCACAPQSICADQCTLDPTLFPTIEPTSESAEPTSDPSVEPTRDPSVEPTCDPSTKPTNNPTNNPTADPIIVTTINSTLDTSQTRERITIATTVFEPVWHVSANTNIMYFVVIPLISAFFIFAVVCMINCCMKQYRRYTEQAFEEIVIKMSRLSFEDQVNNLDIHEMAESNKDDCNTKTVINAINDTTSTQITQYNKEQLAVKKWLKDKVRLEQYFENFMENGYENILFIADITDKSLLEEIGISMRGHVTRMMAQIKLLNPTDTQQTGDVTDAHETDGDEKVTENQQEGDQSEAVSKQEGDKSPSVTPQKPKNEKATKGMDVDDLLIELNENAETIQ